LFDQHNGSSDRQSDSVSCHLSLLLQKVDEVAQQAGVSTSSQLDLTSALAELPEPARRRLRLVLESIRANTDSTDLRTAAHRMLTLATKVWSTNSYEAENRRTFFLVDFNRSQ